MSYTPDSSFQKAGMSKIWDYKTLGANSVFFGVYKYMDTNVGANGSNLYTFMAHKTDKFDSPTEEMSIWGNTILDTRFKNFEPGEEVIVVYKGKNKSEKRKGAEYHDFDVYHRTPKKEEDLNLDELGDEIKLPSDYKPEGF